MNVEQFPELNTKHLVTLTPNDRLELADAYDYLINSIVDTEHNNYRVVLELLCGLVMSEIKASRA